MSCPICRARLAVAGLLCEECRDELSSPIRIMPEQLQLHGACPTPAALIDLWGRPHRLDPRTRIGRQIDGTGLAILEPSVSRRHADLTLDGDAWMLRDLGSVNGTYHDDQPIAGPVRLYNGARVCFGHIAFYFVEDAAALPAPALGRIATVTSRQKAQPHLDEPAPSGVVLGQDDLTGVGLPELPFKLHEPTGGGGGFIDVAGKQVQLTAPMFELMALLIRRMTDEAHHPDLVRGYVRSSELIADLSWDTHDPTENNVKQLVRRVRRALIKSEIGDLIESRHRFGYRLRVIPRPA